MASHHYLIVQPVRMSTPNATEVRSVQLLQQVPPAVGLMIVSQVLRSLFRAIASLPNVEENPQDTQALNHKKTKSSFPALLDAKHHAAITITTNKKRRNSFIFVWFADALHRKYTILYW